MQIMTEVWKEHKDRLRGFIGKRVGDRHAAEDILQEVYLKAHTNMHTLKSSRGVASWLYRIAANAIADHYRRQRPWIELTDEVAAPETERDYLAELAGCLQPLLDKLPEIYRSALMLSEIQGLSQQEVAKRLGLSHSGAKSRVQRGREKLRRLLFECCAIETGRGGVLGYERRSKGECNGCG